MKQVILGFLVCVYSGPLFAFGFLPVCDGPPWDPCELFPSKEVPETQSEANQTLADFPEEMDRLADPNYPIVKRMEKLGFFENDAQGRYEALGIEFCGWMGAYTKPDPKMRRMPESGDLYDVDQCLIDPFLFFEVPYSAPWRSEYCRLVYQPSPEEQAQAQANVAALDLLTLSLVQYQFTPDPNATTPKARAENRQRQLQEKSDALEGFDFEAAIDWCTDRYQVYLATQESMKRSDFRACPRW